VICALRKAISSRTLTLTRITWKSVRTVLIVGMTIIGVLITWMTSMNSLRTSRMEKLLQELKDLQTYMMECSYYDCTMEEAEGEYPYAGDWVNFDDLNDIIEKYEKFLEDVKAQAPKE
jgi:hypothetical protein